VDVAEARVVQAILPPNPGVEALFKHVRHGGHIWELTAVQEVVDLIMIPWRKKAAESEVERVRAMVTAEVLDVLLNVKVAYRRAQAALQHLSMLEQTLASDEAAYAMAHRLRDAGNISKLALRGRKAVLEQTRLVVTNARLRVAETREALTLALGLDGERTAWSVAEELPAMPEDRLDARDVSEAALSNSLDLARARAILTRTAREEGITNVTSLLPELHIGVESEREPDGTWIVGPLVEAPLPLFDWGQAERAIADARVRRAAAEYRMVAVALSSAVRLTMRRLELTRKQAEQYRDVNVPLQESLTQETHLHFNAMQLGVFQLLAAKKEELAMRRRYIDSLRDYWIARAEAEQLMSGRMVAQSAAAASEGMAVGSAGNDGGH
jgi:cobalt-zinc-cadmium efflux system outer membrane protein